jgi:hypothetical protein
MDNHAMVFVLRQTGDNDNGDDALNTANADRNSAAVDGLLTGLLFAELEHLLEPLLVVLEFKRQVPGAFRPAKDGVPLSPHPSLVVGCDSRASDTLKHHLAAVCKRDRDER